MVTLVPVEVLCLMLMSMTLQVFLILQMESKHCSKQLSVFSALTNPLQDYNQAFLYKPLRLQ